MKEKTIDTSSVTLRAPPSPAGEGLIRGKPTNSEFIAMIADNLRLKYKLN